MPYAHTHKRNTPLRALLLLLLQIYGAVIGGHLSSFPPDIRRFGPAILEATIYLHRVACAKFLPTAVKFYYGFNMRDISRMVQVLL